MNFITRYKCQICHKEILIDRISQLIIKHNICNECHNLYACNKKNVKIKGRKITLIFFKNYEYLKFFDSNDNKIKVINFYLEKYHKYNVYLFSTDNLKISLIKVKTSLNKEKIYLIQQIVEDKY